MARALAHLAALAIAGGLAGCDRDADQAGDAPLIERPAIAPEAWFGVDAEAVGFGHDGRWYAARRDHVAVIEDEREVGRLELRAGRGARIAPLAGGRGVAIGGEIVSPAGEVRFSSAEQAERKARWGRVEAAAVGRDGAQVVLAWEGPPSKCLCDEGKPWANGSSGVDLIDRSGEGPPRSRELVRGGAHAEHVVAIGPGQVAVGRRRELQVWSGDAREPVVARRDATATALAWTDDGGALIAVEGDDVVVLSPGLVEQARWAIDGEPVAVVPRPGRAELAIARAPRDEAGRGTIAIHGVDGAVRAELAIAGAPRSIGWDAAGERLLVATDAGYVTRLRVR